MKKATLTKTQNFNQMKMIAQMNAQKDSVFNFESLAFMIALDTGLRVSDILNLKKDKSIFFDTHLQSYVCVTDIQKTGKKNHKSIISESTYKMYYDTINNPKPYTKDWGKEMMLLQNSPYIFTNPRTGKQFTRFWLNKRAKHTFGVNIHQLRKISALKTLEVGTLVDAQVHLGHSRATTTNAYLGVQENDHLERMKLMHKM